MKFYLVKLKLAIARLFRKYVGDFRPYIFLDIDGVLNNQNPEDSEPFHRVFNSCGTGTYDFIDTRLLKIYLDIQKQMNARTVIISSWFHGTGLFYEDAIPTKDIIESLDYIMSMKRTEVDKIRLMQFRTRYNINAVGITESTGGSESRARSILKFVNKHKIRNFVVLDDCGHCWNFTTYFGRKFIPVDGSRGIDSSYVESISNELRK